MDRLRLPFLLLMEPLLPLPLAPIEASWLVVCGVLLEREGLETGVCGGCGECVWSGGVAQFHHLGQGRGEVQQVTHLTQPQFLLQSLVVELRRLHPVQNRVHITADYSLATTTIITSPSFLQQCYSLCKPECILFHPAVLREDLGFRINILLVNLKSSHKIIGR